MAEEENSKLESQEEQPKKERRFNQAQYDLLKKCADKKDMTEWNEWRKKNQDVDVELEGLYRANFYDWYLKGVWLHAYPNKSGKVYLRHANFQAANLRGASFGYAHLEGALFGCSDLQNADFHNTHLENAQLTPSNLKGTDFTESHLENATFRAVVLDGETKFWNCTISKCVSSDVRGTDFTGSQLNVVRISPGTKQLLEYNIRRMNWEEWYKENPKLKWVVKAFWSISDYGISTKKVISTFFSLAIIFATIYFVWGAFDHFILENENPGIVSYLFVNAESESQVHPVCYSFMVYFRAIYFSVVTMTTLGFGDMYANAENGWLAWIVGHLLLILQVILGYVLLGALVTRLAVLFTSDGPAGKFTPMGKKTKELLAKLKEDKSS